MLEVLNCENIEHLELRLLVCVSFSDAIASLTLNLKLLVITLANLSVQNAYIIVIRIVKFFNAD